MLKMEIPVVVESVRRTNDDSKAFAYADLSLQGGLLNVALSIDEFKQLEGKVGEDLLCLFKMKAKSIIDFKRPACVFVPEKFLEIIQ